MRRLVQQIRDLEVRTSVDVPSEFLPSDAVYPVPWRDDVNIVDLFIEQNDDVFCFRYLSRDGGICESTEHASLAEAEAEALRIFGAPLEWRRP